MSITKISEADFRNYNDFNSPTNNIGEQTTDAVDKYVSRLRECYQFALGEKDNRRASLESLCNAVSDLGKMIDVVNADIASLYAEINDLMAQEDRMAARVK